MSGPGVGHEFPPQEVSWQKRDVLLFANSIGCKADELHFLYVRHDTLIFCSFATHTETELASRNSTQTSLSSPLIP